MVGHAALNWLPTKEGAAINGGASMPADYRSIEVDSASTWQCFQRDAVISLGPGKRAVRSLDVSSSRPSGTSANAVFRQGGPG